MAGFAQGAGCSATPLSQLDGINDSLPSLFCGFDFLDTW